MTAAEEILLKEMRYIVSISTGQVKRVAEIALSTVSALGAQQVSVPAGCVLVPIEPTEEMLKAARNAPMPAVWLDSISARANLASSTQYKAMISAAPQPPKETSNDTTHYTTNH